MNCILCSKPGPAANLRHIQCDAEYDKRVSTGTCTMCGEVDANQPDLLCDGCKNNMPGWRGYPGGD